MRDILDKFLPSKKTIFKILQKDYEGEDWKDAKTHEAYYAKDAAEMYADDYRNKLSGEWSEYTEIFLHVKNENEEEINRIAVSFQYSPVYRAREMDKDEE